MLLLAVAVIVLTLTHHFLKTRKYSSLPSPGLALPLVGHVYKLFSAEAQKDPINFVWNLYKKYQRNGLMHLKSFSLNLVFVGDFETLKYLFNHPDVQLRFVNEVMRNISCEERKVKNKEHFPGNPITTSGRNVSISHTLNSPCFTKLFMNLYILFKLYPIRCNLK